MKPRAELASFASLCLPAGIFASHPRQAKRHPCLLLHFPALPFAFSLNRDKTVKYFPRKWPHVISRAVHTIKLSFPSINLQLTSLPQALPQPCSSLLLSQVSASVTQGLGTLLESPLGMLPWKTGQNLHSHCWVSAEVQGECSSHKSRWRNLDFKSAYQVFYGYCEIFKIINGSWLRSAGFACCNSFMFSGRASLWRIKSGPGEDQSSWVTSSQKHNLEVARVVYFIILKPNRSAFNLKFYLQVARKWKLRRPEEIINPYKNFSYSKLIFFLSVGLQEMLMFVSAWDNFILLFCPEIRLERTTWNWDIMNSVRSCFGLTAESKAYIESITSAYGMKYILGWSQRAWWRISSSQGKLVQWHNLKRSTLVLGFIWLLNLIIFLLRD